MFVYRYIIILMIFYSCRSSSTLSKTFPVTTFQGDSSIFEAETNPILYYGDFRGIITLSRDLKPHKKLSIAITTPTLFQFTSGYKKQILYPGENINLSINKKDELIFKIEGHKQRNSEFCFASVYHNLDQKNWPAYPVRTTEYSIDSIVSFEQRIKSEMPEYFTKSQLLFDSLSKVYGVSDQFKKHYKTLIEIDKLNVLFGLYQTYKIELKQNDLYMQKQRELLPYFNSVRNKEFIYLGGAFYIESITEDLIKTKIHFIKTEKELNDALDTVLVNFHNLSRDFLLTKIMYNGMKNGIVISNKTLRKYYSNCKDNEYELIGKKLIREKIKYKLKSKRKTENRLISLSSSRVFTLDEIINSHTGTMLLIDLWASWCSPCLNGMSGLKKIEQKFSNEKFKIIYISFDKEWMKWKNKSEDLGIIPENSYLFENFEKQPFLKTHNVQEIPRYILIDQNGKIITSTAPEPENPELIALIEKNLKR